MKATKVLSTAILFLLPGVITSAYAQEHGQEKQPAEHQQQAKPAQHTEQAKPVKQQAERQTQAKPAKQQAERQTQAKPAKQQAERQTQAKPAKQQAERQDQAKPAQQQQRGQEQQRGQREQASRGSQGAGGHGSIPEAKFRSSFGSGHTFHVNRGEFASGSGRFNYGGYWFSAVNPWPVGWLYTDAVYVDYLNGGYFLCDPVHPGVYLSINVAI
jgi:hypothetical protein